MQIITDSSCDIPQELIDKYKIKVVALNIEIDGKNYIDGVEISHEEFYEKMAESEEIPKTSQPSPQNFIDAFKEGVNKCGEVLSIHLSSKLSGTQDCARIAKNIVTGDIEIFDSLSGSLGLGLQVLEAARLAREGLKIDNIVEKLKEFRDELKVVVYLESLENAVKSGRVTRTREVIANLLNLKPVVHVDGGYVKVLRTMRGKRRAINVLLTMMEEKNISYRDRIVGITHCDCLEDALKLKERIIERFNPAEVLVSTMGPVIGTHAGLGGLLVCF